MREARDGQNQSENRALRPPQCATQADPRGRAACHVAPSAADGRSARSRPRPLVSGRSAHHAQRSASHLRHGSTRFPSGLGFSCASVTTIEVSVWVGRSATRLSSKSRTRTSGNHLKILSSAFAPIDMRFSMIHRRHRRWCTN